MVKQKSRIVEIWESRNVEMQNRRKWDMLKEEVEIFES